MPEYNGDSYFYVHDKTDMEVFHIKNSDTECCCVFMFGTPSEDNKGVAHILEHTVLSGSGRFPLKDPFSQVMLSSPNTFLNAMTFADKTIYPFASPLKKDFDILFDIYADAVFAPLLRRNSFRQEGIRGFDGKFDGVVFNEMCGARSTEDSCVQSALMKALFKGTPYEYDAGGEPLSITDLTYEEFLERYKKWYSPTNCRLFLFGDIDAGEYLDKIETRYLKNREKGKKIIPNSADYTRKELKPEHHRATCPAGDSRSVVLSWLTTPGDDPLEVLTVSVLVDILLGNPGAPLYKAIMESGLGEDLNPISGTDVDSPVLTFTAGFSHAKKDSEKEIEDFLIKQIEKYVREGLPPDAVKAAIKRLEFKIQEIPGDGVPFGIVTCLKASRCWMRGKDPEAGVENVKRLERLKEKFEKGRYFENWMKTNLLNNGRRVLLTVESDDDFDEKFQNRLKAKFKELEKAGLVPSRKEKDDFEKFVNTPDSPEALAKIERITVKDLPKTVLRYKQDLIRLDCGAKLCDFRLFTRGIVYFTLAFDTRNLNLEEKTLLPLLVRTLQMCGTKDRDFAVLSTMMRFLTGSFYLYQSSGTDVHGCPVSAVIVKAKMLKDDFEAALKLISELLTKPDLADGARLKAAVSDSLTEFESNYSYSANSYASISASSVFSATAAESELNLGTTLWFGLSQLKKDLESGKTDYESLSASLTKLHAKVFVRRAMTIHIGSELERESLMRCIAPFADSFPQGRFVRTSDYYRNFKGLRHDGRSDTSPAASPNEILTYTLPSGPAFNALAVKFDRDSEKTYVAAILLASVLSSGYLWETVRGVNGAYGVESHVDGMENLFVFSSYRDPMIKETFNVYLKALEKTPGMTEMEYAIVTIIGREIRPLSPGSKSNEAFRRLLYGMSAGLYPKRRRLLLNMKPEDLRAAADMILSRVKDSSSRAVVCGAEMVKGSEAVGENIFKTIALPL